MLPNDPSQTVNLQNSQPLPETSGAMALLQTMRVCTGCGTKVARQDCHRNRYGEYICRPCQAAGFKFGWRQGLRHRFQYVFRQYALWAAYVLLGLLAVGAFYLILDRFASAPAAAPTQD